MEFIKIVFLFSAISQLNCQPPGGGGAPPGGGGAPPGGGGGQLNIVATNYNFTASTRTESADPILTSWIKSTGMSGYNALTNVNKVQYSAKYVYVSSSNIPSWNPIGPWLGKLNYWLFSNSKIQ